MKISRKIKIDKWNTEKEIQVLSFWENRGFSIKKQSKGMIQLKRGSILGNIASTNMQKILTTLEITYDDNEIKCEYDINRAGQIITKIDREFWDLELETFKSVLSKDGYKVNEWKSYCRKAKIKNALFIAVYFFIGYISYDVMLIIQNSLK